MARELSEIQKKINKELKEVNPTFKACTELQFKNSIDLQKLVAIKNNNYTSEDPFEQIFEYQKLLSKITKVPFFRTEIIQIIECTKMALKIEHKPLLKILSHRDYRDKYNMQATCNTCGALSSMSDLDIKILSWINYCSLIAQYIAFIKYIYPNRTAYKKEEQAYRKSLKTLVEASFMADDHHLKGFLHFYNSYGLNQSKLAMAEYLLDLELPNISTIEIALSVVKYSEFTQVE